ncbi:MAG: hypothetical protein WA952_09535 [Lewinella sp.]
MRQLTVPQSIIVAALILASAYFLGDWAGYPYLLPAFLLIYAYFIGRGKSCRRVGGRI